jgi:diphthamide synthase subunit DPH2
MNEIKGYCKKIVLWGDSNFGACDIPSSSILSSYDVMLHIGHNQFKR